MIRILWAAIVVALSVLAWGGQTLTWLAPAAALRFGLVEAEADLEPAFWADVRGEARWDAMALWVLVVAGALLMIDIQQWAYFGLAGGAIYLYFGGRGILTRSELRRRGLRIGSPRNVATGTTFLVLWGLMGLVTIIAAVADLESS